MGDNDKKTTQICEKYRIMKENPETLLSLVDKHVRVQLIKNSSFVGFVHSIDPISQSVILSVPQVDSYQTILIPGHAVLEITEMKPITNVQPPTRKPCTLSLSEDLTFCKKRLISWLKLNLLPVEEDGDKIIFGNACLLPPYTTRDICTDNPIVVMQVKKLIEDMPQDFIAK